MSLAAVRRFIMLWYEYDKGEYTETHLWHCEARVRTMRIVFDWSL